MDAIRMEDVKGYRLGEENLCCACITHDEIMTLIEYDCPGEVLTPDRLKKSGLLICSRCQAWIK